MILIKEYRCNSTLGLVVLHNGQKKSIMIPKRRENTAFQYAREILGSGQVATKPARWGSEKDEGLAALIVGIVAPGAVLFTPLSTVLPPIALIVFFLSIMVILASVALASLKGATVKEPLQGHQTFPKRFQTIDVYLAR